MNIYEKSAELLLGSRLKRAGEKIFTDISKLYKSRDIEFEPAWFPIFYMLNTNDSINVTDIAREMEISLSGASQMVNSLAKKGVISCSVSKSDKRYKTVKLSKKGQNILSQVKPVWDEIEIKLNTLLNSGEYSQYLMRGIEELERSFESLSSYLQSNKSDSVNSSVSDQDCTDNKNIIKKILKEVKMSDKSIFNYGEDKLTAKVALDIVADRTRGVINPEALKKITQSKNSVDYVVESDRVVYGINTGFGPLCSVKISPEDTKKLQYNILKSHSSGVGEPIPYEVAKAMMILKVHALSMGFSGIAPETLDRIIWHINNNVIPVVPCQGSVGASGDLAPLSHLFLPLIGLGRVLYKGEVTDTAKVLKKEGLKPVNLGPKEGLALINGTQFMASFALRGLSRFLNCLDTADIAGAMTIEGLLGSDKPFTAALHELRPYSGTIHVAHRMRNILKDSEMVASHRNCIRVQDPYSLRCIPQVHGASRNAWLHLKNTVITEMNSVTDNPVILSKEESISGGNFHGEPIALPVDYAALGASELGNISDRRTYLLLEGGFNNLPKLLIKDSGLNSGFMIPQYTSAALASENKSLCFPASADSIPTSLGQEDHVSMGSISVRKFNRIIDNLENILAVELLCAAQAFDFRRPAKSSAVIEACHALLREKIDFADTDRVFGEDLVKAKELVASGEIVKTSLQSAEKAGIELDPEDSEFFV